MKRRCLLGFVLGTATSAALAHADLGADVATLRASRAVYGRVVRLKPRLIERGERLPLPIPVELLNPKDSSCTTLSILGVVGLHFAVRFSELDPGAPSTAFPEASAAGASEVTRCGSSKPYLASVLLEMRSPRGVIETVVSNTPTVVPSLPEVLPGRDPGSELPLGDPGPRPALPPLAERLQRLTARAHREGSLALEQAPLSAGEDGAGAAPLTLLAGCHELTLLADPPAGETPVVDLDLELVNEESGARLAIDRADDADGSLSVCVGSPTLVQLRFVGATPRARLSLVHARWDLPIGLPGAWSTDSRARLASLARAQHLLLQKQPIYSSLGVQGTTELPLEVEAGVCYSALVAPLRGEVRSLSLSVAAHAPGEVPRGAADTEGSAVSFCAHGARHATLEVSGEGANLAWLLAVWESGRTAIGVREP